MAILNATSSFSGEDFSDLQSEFCISFKHITIDLVLNLDFNPIVDVQTDKSLVVSDKDGACMSRSWWWEHGGRAGQAGTGTFLQANQRARHKCHTILLSLHRLFIYLILLKSRNIDTKYKYSFLN